MPKHIVTLILLFISFCSFSQQKVTLELNESPLTEALDAIEQQTGLRIFFIPQQVDIYKITIKVENEEVTPLLEKILHGTLLSFYSYENYIFITENQPFTTFLPSAKNEIRDSLDFGGQQSFMSSLLHQKEKGISENKLYEIGTHTTNIPNSVTLHGTVTDFNTGEAMVGVSLYHPATQAGTITDSQGNYSIKIPGGKNELQIQGMGFKNTRRQLMAYADGEFDIEIEEQMYTLDEVIISSERDQNIKRTALGVERLQMNRIKNIPTAFGETDIMKIVLSLPGVKSTGEASTGFNVRGGSTDQNLILFNGSTLYNPSHLFGFFSAINPDVIENMEFYKSSIPAQYGGRISSVLELNSRKGNKKEIKGAASLGLLTSRLTVEGPILKDKTSFILGGRTTYSNWILRQLPEKSGYNKGEAGFYDITAIVNHTFDEKNSLDLHTYFSHDQFSFSKEDHYSYQNINTSASWQHTIKPGLISTISGGYDHYDYETWNVEDEFKGYTLTYNINQIFGKSRFIWQPNHKHVIDFGLHALFYFTSPGKQTPRGDGSLLATDQLQKEKALETALFINEKWDITPQFSVQAGIRYSMFNALGPRDYFTYEPDQLPSTSTVVEEKHAGGFYKTYQGPEYRLSARYELPYEFSIKVGYNTMRQYIHKISNTTTMSPTDTWKLSDFNIRPQTGSQFAAGIYKNLFNSQIEVSVEAYYKDMKHYLDYRGGAKLVMNHHIETDVIETVGKAYGIEALIKKETGKLTGWMSYTYSRTQLRQQDVRITEPVNNGNWYSADYDKPHEFKLVGNYKFTQRLSLSVNCEYSTGRPITLPMSKYEYAGGEYIYYTDRNSYRISDFFRIDSSFNIEPSHHLTLLTHSSVSIGLYNLTGRKNIYSVYYLNEGGELKGYKLAIFGIPVPYISYNIKF